jgi:hypothetical protein
VLYLESRLAEMASSSSQLGSEDARVGKPDPAPTYTHREAFEGLQNAHSSVLKVANVALGSMVTPSLLQTDSGIHYEAKLFYASERPPLKIPVRGIYNEESPRMASRGSAFRLPDTGALAIPFTVAKTLFDNYLSNILPRYPCFLKADLVDQFTLFYSSPEDHEQLPDTTSFIVSMVLAISSLTSKAHDFTKVASLSESLQQHALRHSAFLRDCSIRSLQCFLLLIQMVLLLPYTANAWYLSGEAMRLAIALGLHQEPEWFSDLHPSQITLRRCIFWTV